MNWIEIISPILNVVLGSGLIVTFITLRATRREAYANAQKAEAGAKTSEIDNADAVAKMWRTLAEDMSERQNKLAEQVDVLSLEVRRLKNATNRVVRLLDRITPDNLSEMIEKIKQEINDEHTDIYTHSHPADTDGLQGKAGGNHRARANG